MADNGAAPSPELGPGEVTPAELGTLYEAARIELRAAREQNEVLRAVVRQLFDALGVAGPAEAMERIGELTASRTARRAGGKRPAARPKS